MSEKIDVPGPSRDLPSVNDEHHQLYRDVREAISSLPVYFRTETHISGIMATDLQTLNTVLGATIEEQVVRTLNLLRKEDSRYFLQAFRRPVLEVQENDEGATLVSDDTDDAINDGHYFELMDRVSVALDYVYQFLGSHPLMKKDERLQEVYEKAEESLAELYQRAGLLEFDRSSS